MCCHARLPRVAAARQPWAAFRNPFGIPLGCLPQSLRDIPCATSSQKADCLLSDHTCIFPAHRIWRKKNRSAHEVDERTITRNREGNQWSESSLDDRKCGRMNTLPTPSSACPFDGHFPCITHGGLHRARMQASATDKESPFRRHSPQLPPFSMSPTLTFRRVALIVCCR
jgi:hypothetical protein